MNISHALLSIKRYGTKGLVNWLKRCLFGSDLEIQLKKTAIKSPGHKPIKGITLIGDFTPQKGSLCKVVNDIDIALSASDIPHQIYDVAASQHDGFAINRFSHIIGMFGVPNVHYKGCQLFRIAFWEFESGFINYYPYFSEGAPVLVLTDFCKTSLQKQLPQSIPVHKILYPFSFKPNKIIDPDTMRQNLGLAKDDFCVFFNFDYRSGFNRKNPEGVLRAFAQSLKEKPNAKLVFKTMRSKTNPDSFQRLHALAKDLGIENRLIEITDFISNDELIGLTNACDVYISLHRGEGFGLGIAEAMSLGKAVIASDYSATTEFCNANNSIPIPCKFIAPRPDQMDIDNYKNVTSWADPDIPSAAKALKRLYEDRDYRIKLGENAKSFIDEYFALSNFKKSVLEFLSQTSPLP